MIAPKDPQSEAMSEFQHMQKQPKSKLKNSLKSKTAKTRKLCEFSKTEINRLANLNAMLETLKRGKTRKTASWLNG